MPYHLENHLKLSPKAIFLILSVVVLVGLLSLVFYLKKVLLKPKPPPGPKVAIVIDDWGYNLRCINLLKEMDIPLTVSILPNLKYSSKIAEVAHNLGREVILHLPLEPERQGRGIGLEEYTITCEMSEEEIFVIFERALSSVPYASGISNHMGSRATKDKRIMLLIFSELKKRDLFFLDNLVIDKSICRELAQGGKVKFIARDVFLDNLKDKEYIRGQLKELAQLTRQSREAVGIGHAKPETFEVLKEEVALMQAEGIEFVFISELIK